MTISNAPPVAVHGMHIDDLYDEAKGILDGAGVQSDADAEMVAKLLDMARQAKKAADEQRAIEKRPHDDAAKAVQAAWKPLTDKCDLITATCKKALEPFLTAKEAAQRASAERVAREAEEARAAALAARQAASPDDLTAREEAERLDTIAGEAEKQAAKAAKAKAHATGGSRAIGLRTNYVAEVTDFAAFSRWVWEHRRADCEEWLSDMAQQVARRGVADIPGIIIQPDRKAA